MERPANWKVLTLGAALAGLGAGLSVAGVPAAQADSGSTRVPASMDLATDLNAPLFNSGGSWGSAWGSPWYPGENIGQWVPWHPGQVIDNWVPWINGPWR